jgi:hypothetical protein
MKTQIKSSTDKRAKSREFRFASADLKRFAEKYYATKRVAAFAM